MIQKSILFIVSCFCDKFDDNHLRLTLSDTIFVEISTWGGGEAWNQDSIYGEAPHKMHNG